VANSATRIQSVSNVSVKLMDGPTGTLCQMMYLVADRKFFALILPEHSKVALLKRLKILEVKLRVLQGKGIGVARNNSKLFLEQVIINVEFSFKILKALIFFKFFFRL
jgi:hypothetical protein